MENFPKPTRKNFVGIRREHVMKKTKIICTIGPASDTKEKIAALTDAGCDVVRLNFSHGTHENYAKKIKIIKQVREEKHLCGHLRRFITGR